MWFMQTKASPIYLTALGNYFNSKYPKRWVHQCGPIARPAKSPDLVFPLDFYKRGHVKIRYVTKQTKQGKKG